MQEESDSEDSFGGGASLIPVRQAALELEHDY
jgi:hypothetical protein